jgi:1,4-dihydroxy-2-naphthoate octaprenyltransferase
MALSRLPFHTVGVLPFILGAVLAYRQAGPYRWSNWAGEFRWDIFGWGTAGVVLVMLSTYYANEFWDEAEDALASQMEPSRFAGGSQVLQRGLLPRRAALWGSLVSLALALGVALLLQLGYRTGPWTVPFALLGLAGGFFYSARPVRWVRTGLGEPWIALNYGWLPVAVGYYLQVGELVPLVHWLAAPIGLTILNVILLNEFPDYPADRQAGKANWTVRLGPERAAWVYARAGVASWAAMLLSLGRGVPLRALWFYLPVLLLSLILVLQMLRGRWRERDVLEILCGANLLVNLGTTLAYILAFAVG